MYIYLHINSCCNSSQIKWEGSGDIKKIILYNEVIDYFSPWFAAHKTKLRYTKCLVCHEPWPSVLQSKREVIFLTNFVQAIFILCELLYICRPIYSGRSAAR